VDIGNKLYELRKSKNLSQEELADRLNVTRQTISKWETNQSTPDFDKIIPLCEIYGISADELLTGVKEEKETLTEKEDDSLKRKKRAIGISTGIFIYIFAIAFIMTSIPVFRIDPVIAAAIFLLILGIGTVTIVLSCIFNKTKKIKEKKEESLKDKQVKQICDIIAIIVLIIYLLISFLTMAWHITWIIWIIYALIEKIVQLMFNYGGEDNE
jgi:transcriptional regulator with XRE-family HTH domain